MMKKVSIKLFLFVILSVFPLASMKAQKLESYKQICIDIRKAFKTENRSDLISCLNRLDDSCNINIKEYPEDKFVTIQPEIEDPLKGHIQFSSKYLLEVIKLGFGKRDSIPVDLHIGNRPGCTDVLITHRVVPANGEGLYKFKGNRKMEIVVVSEDETPIEIRIECMDGMVEYESRGSTILGCQEYKWNMGEEYSEILLTIKNPSPYPVCCVIATN